MAKELDLPKALAELITQLNNLRRLITIGGKQYKYDAKSNSYKGDGGKSFSVSQLKGKAREFYKTVTTPKAKNRLKIKDQKTFSRAPKKNLVQTPSPTWGVDKKKTTKATPKTTAKYTVRDTYKKTGKPPVQIEPKKLLKAGKKYGGKAVKQLKRIKNIPGAGMVGRGVARGAGIATGALATLDLVDSAAGAVRTGGNIYRRLKGQPLLEDIGGFGKAEKFYRIKEKNEYLKKHGSLKGFDKSVSRWNKKKTDNNKTTPTATTKKKKLTPDDTSPKSAEIAQLKESIKKAKGWNKTQLEKQLKHLRSYGKLSSIPRKEGNATIKGKDGVGKRINPNFGKKSNITSSKKKGSSGKKMHPIEKRNREIHGDDRIDAVKKYHEGWKKARKEGRLEEWKKKNKARRGWQ